MTADEDPDGTELVPEHATAWFVLAAGSAGFVLLAVALELLAGSFANSPVPGWAELVPLAWPRPLRVLWWTTVAVAAAGFRLGLHRLGFRQRAPVVLASVVPFVAFAAGVAAGAGWATWH